VTLAIPGPLVRIGLTTDRRHLTLSSGGGFHLVDADTGSDLWRKRHQGPVHIVLQHRNGGPASRYRVQVASLKDRERAQLLRQRIEKETGEVVEMTDDPVRGTYRVRVGAASSRAAVGEVERKLRSMGFAETWIVEEAVDVSGRSRLRLVDEEYEDLVIESRRILAAPVAPGEPLLVNGTPYRGVVEVLVPGRARLRAVNVLNLEEYLRGVVPLELGPLVYPEVEALKAQAVAARTYAVANRGQYEAEGFDICDTARCQVYGGLEAEDPFSDRAVEETVGLILTHEGEPINALYTATCGGHTEDVENVFRQEDLPYLRGVSCYAEEAALAAWRTTLRGAAPPAPAPDPSGEDLGEALALLPLLGVADPAILSPSQLTAIATQPEIEGAVRRTLALVGKEPPEVSLPQSVYPSAAALARYLVEALGWRERVSLLLDDRDLPSLLGGALLPGGASEGREESAYLIKEGILPARLGPGDDLLAPATRGLLYRALYRILRMYEALGLEHGIYRGSRGESLIIVPEAMELAGLAVAVEVQPSAAPALVRGDGEESMLVRELTLVPGDRVAYHVSEGQVDFIRLKANVKGASDDRFTPYYQWEVRYSREELEDRIRQRASIGRLIDLVPAKRGVSGRVSRLTVVGSRGRFSFSGFGIRSLLGVRETLFVVDRQRGPSGRIETFIFSGKGWGHGVGMCQVGAFGMALRGARHDEILNRYYTGVRIEPFVEEGSP
jgi:stage II sporulation protein D